MNKSRIYIFGRGAYYKAKESTFSQQYTVEAFIDNAVSEEKLDSLIPVYNPQKLSELPPYDIFCVSSSWFSMWKQLIDLGVDGKRIKFGTSIFPLQDGIEKTISDDNGSIISEGKKLYYVSDSVGKVEIDSEDDIKIVMRHIVSNNSSLVAIKSLEDEPISRFFGSERGKAVDRYYIEQFLEKNKMYIRGTVLEVLNNKYTKQFGEDRVVESIVSHVKGWGDNTILCNFETSEGIIEDKFDCIICTQTLQYIYELKAAIVNIFKMLKDGGTALITVPGIKQLCEYDNNNWGEYWSFTSNSLKRICCEIFDEEKVEITQYGNVKTSTAYLYGVCSEELLPEDFANNDPLYPFLICAKVTR